MQLSSSPDRWTQLYKDAFPRVYRALAATLLDGEAARDALHDAFLEGLRRSPANDANLHGWLYRVALRKARRALLRRPTIVPVRPEASSAGGLDLSLDRIEVGQLLGLLTERQRSIVVAHYYLGLTHAELAELLGISRGTVGATITQSIARMRGARANV